MEIGRAMPQDLSGIISLLHQVHDIHSAKRPDIFRRGNRKYTDGQILDIIADEKTPVYVAGLLLGVLPIGDWSIAITLSKYSIP